METIEQNEIDTVEDDAPQVPAHKPFPNLPQSWGLLGLFILFSFGLGMLLAPLLLVTGKNTNTQIILLVLFYIGAFSLVFIYVKQKFTIQKEDFTLQFKKQPLLVFFFLLIITVLTAIIIKPISSSIPLPSFLNDMPDEVAMGAMEFSDVIFLLLIVIAAPVCEEILFRGVIMDGLLRNKMNPYFAVFWSSLLFAVMHLNPWQGVTAFILGTLLDWVYYKTRSLWACIFIHAVNNGYVMLMAYIVPESYTDRGFSGDDNYIVFYLGVVVVAAVLVLILNKIFDKEKMPQHKPNLYDSIKSDTNL